MIPSDGRRLKKAYVLEAVDFGAQFLGSPLILHVHGIHFECE